MSEEQIERELTPQELATQYPKMLYRLKPTPSYNEAEDPAHEAKLLKEGWVRRDKLTARQIEMCANQDQFMRVDHVDPTGNDADAKAFQLHSIAMSDMREELLQHIDRLEQKINVLEVAMQQPEQEPVQTETSQKPQEPDDSQSEGTTNPSGGEGDEGDEGGEGGEGDDGPTGQGDTPQEPRYEEIAPVIAQFLQKDPEKQDSLLWTKAGSPNAGALSEALGFEVKADERDNVWERYKRAQSRLPK